MKFRLAAVAATSLVLAACGSADDASTEAEADTVEYSADEAMATVDEEPVADPAATAQPAATSTTTAPSASEADSVEDAGDNAAATAEAAMDAMAEDSEQ